MYILQPIFNLLLSLDSTKWAAHDIMDYSGKPEQDGWPSSNFQLTPGSYLNWGCNASDFITQSVCSTVCLATQTTLQYHYNMANFLPNTHNRHHIAHLWGWDLGCILWVWSLIYVLLESLQCCIQYYWPALRAGLLFCNFFDMLTPVPYHHFFSSLILLFIYV